MALSGTFSAPAGPYNKLQVEWTATQNISGNSTTITARLYWMANRSGVGAVYASTPGAVSITINGSTSAAESTGPRLTAGQKRHIRTHTVTVPHNSDGTKSTTISAYFDVDATLSGQPIGRVNVSDSVTLNTIPRESSLSSSANFTAGNNLTLTVNRYSSSFGHDIEIYVKNRAGSWVNIKTQVLSTKESAKSSQFSTADVTKIFDTLDGRASADTRFITKTFSGSTLIGSHTKTGTVTAPNATHLKSGYDQYWFTDENISLPLGWYNSSFSHTVRFKIGSYTKTITGVTGNTVSWTPTTAERNSIASQMPTSSYINASVEIDTFYNGEKVRDTTSNFIQFHVRDSDPTLTGTLSYADTNSSIVTITQSNQYIVSGKSTVTATLASGFVATPKNGATLVSLTATLAGKTITIPYSTGAKTFAFGTITASTNQTLTVRVVDSRGNFAQISKMVNVVPYEAPKLATSAERINGFEASTKINMSGSFSPVMVLGSAKNNITTTRYRTRVKGQSWSGYTVMARSAPGNTYIVPERNITLAIDKAYDVEFSVTDMFGETTAIRSVGVGRPILFLDDRLGSIGFGDYPTQEGEFLVNGKMRFAGNQWASTGGGLDMGNGDIVGANGIFFNDLSTAAGEGLNWATSSTPVGSTSAADYETLSVANGIMKLDSTEVLRKNVQVIWTGYSFLHGTVNIPYGRDLSEFPNGVILLWSRYVNSAPANSDWNVTIVPKNYGTYAGNSGMWAQLVAANVNATVPPVAFKYFYPSGTSLIGHGRNNTGTESGQVLRALLGF